MSALSAKGAGVGERANVRSRAPAARLAVRVVDDGWLTADLVVNSSSIPTTITARAQRCDNVRRTGLRHERHPSPPRIHQRQLAL